jgi:hypothetical protein
VLLAKILPDVSLSVTCTRDRPVVLVWLLRFLLFMDEGSGGCLSRCSGMRVCGRVVSRGEVVEGCILLCLRGDHIVLNVRGEW